MPNLRVILSLGTVAHESTLRALCKKPTDFKFAHGAVHDVGDGTILVNTYHSSRYNVNTGRLTRSMFDDVFKTIASTLSQEDRAAC